MGRERHFKQKNGFLAVSDLLEENNSPEFSEDKDYYMGLISLLITESYVPTSLHVW